MGERLYKLCFFLHPCYCQILLLYYYYHYIYIILIIPVRITYIIQYISVLIVTAVTMVTPTCCMVTHTSYTIYVYVYPIWTCPYRDIFK